MSLEYTIPIKTENSADKYWIKIRRNNRYIPHHDSRFHNKKTSSLRQENPYDWHIVTTKKKGLKLPQEQPIYYWIVVDHNLFNRDGQESVDPDNQNIKLFFTDPDTTQIENIDQNNYMSIDPLGQLRLIHVCLKHKGMKMTPTYYIARSVKQIEDALNFVKYCVVKTENNEQKMVEI